MPVIAPLIGQVALNLAVGIGVSLLAEALRPKQSITPVLDSQSVTTSRGISFDLVVGESVPVSAIFGRGRTGGHLLFAQEYGTNNEYLKLVIACGKGWYDGHETAIVDEKVVTLSGSNAGTDGFVVDEYRLDANGDPSPTGTPYMWMKFYDGAPGQVADPGLVAAANPSGRWGSNHKVTGTPYVIVTLRYHANLYGGVLPRFGFVWRGLRLYDWRLDSTVAGGSGSHRWDDQSTWEWTDNPAVIAWNYRRGYWINGVRVLGQGFSFYSNDLAYFTAAANVSDEPISYPETSATLPRYTFGREISDDEDPTQILRELESSWCGSSFPRGGAYAPVPAQTQSPFFVLEDRHRLDGYAISADRRGSVSTKKTTWHGEFVSAAEGWQLRPYGTRSSATLVSTIGGHRRQPLDQRYESRTERAQMRAEIALRRNLFPGRRKETFGPIALVLEPGDCIIRNCEWGAVPMIVESVDILEHRPGVTVELTEWDNSIVPASGEAFIDVPAGPGPGPADPDRTIAVSGFDVEPYQQSGGGALHSMARASWTQITDPNVDQILIRYWPSAGNETDDSEDKFVSRLQTKAVFGPLVPTTLYTAKAMPVRTDGRATVFTNEIEFLSPDESVPIAVPDDSITLNQLVQELRNEIGLVNTSFPGSIPDQLAQILATMEQLAANLITGDQLNKQRISALVAQQGGSSAAVIRNEQAIVGLDEAFAGLSEEVIAVVNNVLASGLIKFEATVADGGASSTIAILTRASVDDEFAEAGIYIKAQADGLGNTSSSVLISATANEEGSHILVGSNIFRIYAKLSA